MGLKVQLLDIFSRLTKFDKKAGIIVNGADNLYPERIEAILNNSVTAKTAAVMMAAYLAGKGFGEDIDSIIVNEKNKTTLKRFTSKLSKSFSKQHGAFIHVNFDMTFQHSSFDVLPYSHCRLGKKDDNKYNGKIGVTDKWSQKKVKQEEINFIDVYNPNEDVIKSQVEACKGEKDVEKWKQYKGQILYINLDPEYDYALSTIDAVLHDCDSEGQASLFKNKSLRKGFFGKTMVITKPLIGNIDEYPDTPDGRKLYNNAVSEREDFKNTLNDFIGVENAGGVLHVELEHDEDNIDAAIKFQNISSDIDDKLFEYTETSVFKNILMAFNNIPSGLVRSDNALFGNSGESLKEMQRVYQNNTNAERNELVQVIQMLMDKFTNKQENLELELLIDETDTAPREPQEMNLMITPRKNEVIN